MIISVLTSYQPIGNTNILLRLFVNRELEKDNKTSKKFNQILLISRFYKENEKDLLNKEKLLDYFEFTDEKLYKRNQLKDLELYENIIIEKINIHIENKSNQLKELNRNIIKSNRLKKEQNRILSEFIRGGNYNE